VLTKCRGWLVTTSCRSYHHIRLPSRIAVGDTITMLFASHPKEFGFSVARIELKGQHCAILSEADGDRHRMDKIDVAPVTGQTRSADRRPFSFTTNLFDAERFDAASRRLR
jgi:hypothetical protein